MLSRIIWWVCLLCGLYACEDNIPRHAIDDFPALMELPSSFSPIDFPPDNAYTYERWRLGKQLFFDPSLSRDSSISCASCHHPELAFSDSLPVSRGVDGLLGRRNAPSLANVAYHPYFTREGGVATLEMQALVPIQEHDEFDFNIVLIAQRLKADSTYVRWSMDAYNRPPDAFVIVRSIATFERSLISGNSAYDEYLDGADRLTDSQERGMDLFFSDRTQCSSCHEGFNFTNYAFENNGLYASYPDEGRFRLTGEETDRALFKVPSLRNVAQTSPYMHDGSLVSLEAVVNHYNRGGVGHPNQSNLLEPLNLTAAEQTDLVQFLKSLTDESFLENPLFTE